MKQNSKKSFLLYHDMKTILDMMPDEHAGKLIKIIVDYVNGIFIDIDKLDVMLKFAFVPIKAQLDRALSEYDRICKQNVINGSKGGKTKNDRLKKIPSLPSATERYHSRTNLADKIREDIDTETDTETGRDIEIYTAPFEFELEIQNHKFTESNILSIKNFYYHRIELGKPFFKTGFINFLHQCELFIIDGININDLIATSINNNWAVIYKPKIQNEELLQPFTFHPDTDADDLTHEQRLSNITASAYKNWMDIAEKQEMEFTVYEWDLIYGYVMSVPNLSISQITTTLISLQKWASEGKDIENAILNGHGYKTLREPRAGSYIDQKTNKQVYGIPYINRRLSMITKEKLEKGIN